MKRLIWTLVLCCIISGPVFAITFDKSNSIYVSTLGEGVKRYNATTGAYIENAISASDMANVLGIAFAPDGKLWAVNNSIIKRFNESGLVDTLTVPPGTLPWAEAIAFGPDGNAYIVNVNDTAPTRVVKFNGTTGAYMGVVIDVAAAVPNSGRAWGITFGPDGKLNLGIYKTASPSNLCTIERFDSSTYAWLGTFSNFAIGDGPPKAIAYGRGGTQLAVTGYYGNLAYRFNGATGGPGAVNLTGITRPVGAAYGPDGSIYVVSEAGSVVKHDINDSRSTFCTVGPSPQYIIATGQQSQNSFNVWTISPYVNISKQETPGTGSQVLNNIAVLMAKGEYRDTVFMISNNLSSSEQITISLETTNSALQAATLIQEALYITNSSNQVVGGAHYKLETALTIPAGESRQIRIRFNAKSGALAAGQYSFNIRLSDSQNSYEKVILVTLTVWNFELPNAATFMLNNTYAQLSQTSLSDMNDLMVKDMKEYGLNVFQAHPKDISVVGSDGSITFQFWKLDEYLNMVMSNWGSGQKPKFIFHLGYGICPSEARFTSWATQFEAVVENYGLTWSDWCFEIGDEADETGLINSELPFQEMWKRRASNSRAFNNSSAIISDPNYRARYFASTDRFEPDLDRCKENPNILPYFRANAGSKPISLFRCRATWAVGADMYNYYRVYGWEAFREGSIGIGLWDYCVDWNMNPWTGQENPYVMVFRHPTKRDLVHSRRYEAFREGIDDYRYLYKLRQLAQTRSTQDQTDAENLIQSAIADITSNIADTTRCDTWRVQIANKIQTFQVTACGDSTHPYPPGDINNDCRVNFLDVSTFAEHWMECTRPNGCN